MRKGLKVILIIIPIFIAIILFSLFLLKLNKPNHQLTDGFYVTIKGEVTTSDTKFDKTSKPNIVQVYHSYFSTQWLCRTQSMQIANISWDEKKNTGTYIATFWLPVDEEVIVTPNCYGCLNERVYLSKEQNSKEVNLKWDSNICSERQKTYDNSEQALDRAIELLDGADTVLSEKEFNDSSKKAIKQYITAGRELVRGGRQTQNENESLFHGYYATLNALKAFHKIQVIELELCVKQAEKVLNNHTDDCYIPPYESYESYRAANSSTESNIFNYLDNYRYDKYEDIQDVRQDIDRVQENEERVSQVKYECERALRTIAESFEHQEPYCKRRKLTINFVNFSLVSLFLAVGFAIGKYAERW